jgi:uncharacterized protein (DUF885 family)
MPVRRVVILIAALALALTACTDSSTTSTSASPSPAESTTTSSTTASAEPADGALPTDPLGALDELAFDNFLEASYEVLLLRQPQFLTSLGVAAQFGLRNDQLDDLSPEYLTETQRLEVEILDRLGRFDRDHLTTEQQISFDVYEWYLDQQVAGHRFAYHDWPVHHFVNGYNFNLILFLAEEHPLATLDDAEDYISRLSAIDDQVDQVLARLRVSQDMGITPPQFLVPWTLQTLRADLGGTSNPDNVRMTDLDLYTAFATRTEEAGFDAAVRDELLERVEAELTSSFIPAWLELIEYMEGVEEVASPEAGVWRLPDGDEYYNWLLRDHTSTGLTPEQVHQIGLEEVERVQGEMRAAFAALGYPADNSIGQSRQRANQEAGFLNTGDATQRAIVVRAYEDLITEAELAMRPFFGIWPEADVEIVADPAGGGYYVAASVDGSRPGQFHANVGGRVSKYLMATITYHEAVAGHHTQIAIAQELDLPTFRRYLQYNAFAEGWALYAERLAAEAGLYETDPYGNVGRLELELLRAVRLVVDTGLHALQWDRDEAHDYIARTLPGWDHEVERYIVLPGQATGYMIGMQTLLDLRGDASTPEELAAFHDLVLGGGSMPLEVLAEVVGG